MPNPVKIPARVRHVTRHTDRVASYVFEPLGRVPRFQPGQFLHLALDEYRIGYAWPDSRVFSIASSPTERKETLAITVSAKGRFTGQMLDRLETGSSCWLKLPYGDFTFGNHEHITLIAGGVGITPFVSLLKNMLEQKSDRAVTLFYGVRQPELYLFSDLLADCERELNHFRCVLYCEDGSTVGRSGRINIQEIFHETEAETIYYLSGPLPMVRTFEKALAAFKVPPQRIRIDDWGI